MGKKLLWKVLPVAFLAGVGSTAFTSCADEYDPAKITREDILKENYAKNWEEVFGTPDPNQDWSMAQPVTATISVPSVNDATLRVMTKSPMNRNCYLLSKTKVDGNMLNLQFDVVKGTKNVYVELKDANGRYLIDGYFPVENGKVVVDKSFASTREGGATPSEWELWSKDSKEVEVDGETTLVPAPGYVSFTRFNNGLVPNPLVKKPYTTEPYLEYVSSFDYSLYPAYKFEAGGDNKIGKFYTLKNVDLTQKSDERDLGDMYPLFFQYESTVDGAMKIGPFKESENHVKRYLGETPPAAGELKLEKDAKFETKGGEPVTITLVGKGTEMSNDVGYFYYPKSRETEYFRPDGTFKFEKVNKFILVEGMSDTSKRLMVGTDYNKVDDKNCSYTTEKFQSGAAYAYAHPGEILYKGAVLTLKYYGDGETPNATGTDFDEGYVIGFFSIRTDKGGGDVQHINTSFATVQLNYFNDYPRGASFKYKGKAYLGIEDDTDYDINDYLFELAGVKTTNLTDVTPEDDPDYEPEPQTWTVACEDLGGYFDYDFNDLVFGIRVSDNAGGTSKKIELIPLAAGGTLEAKIEYDGNEVGEIHDLVQPGAPTTSPINVSPGQSVTENPEQIQILQSEATAEEATVANIMSKLVIKVTTNGNSADYNIGYNYEKGNVEKKTPQVIVFPAGWDWPSEDTFICDVYPKFAQWTQDKDVTTWCNDAPAGNFVHSPYAKVVNGGGNTTPVTPPSSDPVKSANNLNIVTSVKITLPGDGGVGSVVDHYTTSSTGEVTAVSNNNKVTVVVDQEAKTITLSATEVVSNVTVTVTQAEDENYLSGTKTITVSSVDPYAGPAFTIDGVAVPDEDIALSNGGYGDNYYFTIDKKYFSGDITKITVVLTSISDTKLNAAVMSDGKFDGLKQSPTGTAVITSADDINTIKNSGLTIIDWAIPYGGGDKIGSVSITIEK